MELLSINLYELIKANGFAGFSTVLIHRFTMQMPSALALMRHHHVVHCDLKLRSPSLQNVNEMLLPSNLLHSFTSLFQPVCVLSAIINDSFITILLLY